MNQFNKFDANLYDSYIKWDVGDVQFFIEEALAANGEVLEIGCGTGRITIPLAQNGVQVTGLDLSHEMLEILKQKADKLKVSEKKRITFLYGDMRNFQLEKRFSLIIIPFRAFQHILTPGEQRIALENIRSHLSPQGRLIINVFDPNLDIICSHSGYLGHALKLSGEFHHPTSGNSVLIWDSREYNRAEQVLHEIRYFEEIDSDGVVISRHYIDMHLRYMFRYEMQYLLEVCGYKMLGLYGDFQRNPFIAGGEQIWIVEKV